jgi:peptide/nickel transport system substrate-binding protein
LIDRDLCSWRAPSLQQDIGGTTVSSTLSRRRLLGRLGSLGILASAAGLLAACQSAAPAASPTTAPAAAAPTTAPAQAAPAATAAKPAATTAPAAAATSAPAASATSAPAAAAANEKKASVQKLITGVSDLPPTVDGMATLHNTPRTYDLYEPLLNLDPDANLKPMLALSWQRIDDTTYQLKLRPDVKFHNGDSFTADDVKFSLERATRTTKPLPTASVFDTYKGAEINDPMTITIMSKAPDALFLKKLARIGMYPQKYYTGLGADDDTRDKAFAAAPVGTGPYQFVAFAAADKLDLKAFTTHSWRTPTLTDLTFRQFADVAAQKNSFLSGEVHYINYQPVSAVPQLKSAGATILTIVKDGSLGSWMDAIAPDGTAKQGPMGDVRVRQAINYAVDKDKLVKDILGGLTNAQQGQIPTHGIYGFNPNVQPYTYDKAKAEQLLDQAGFAKGADGNRFTVTMASAVSPPGSIGRDMGEFVQNQLQMVGIKVDYTPLTDIALAIDYFYGRKPRPDIYNFQLNLRPLLDPEAAYTWFRSDNPTHHYNNPEFDQTFLASQKELDPEKRQTLLWKLTDMLHNDVPYLFLIEALSIEAATAKLRGVIAHPAEFDQYYDTLYFVE